MASPAYQYGALSAVLEEYVLQTNDTHYARLFSPETGYLKCEGKSQTWAVSYAPPKNPEMFLANLVAVREGLRGQKALAISNALHLIQRVNQVYCDAVFGTGEIPVMKGGVIGFNSRCKDVTQVLSNFFSSLLIFPDPLTDSDVVFPDSESAYQAHKRLGVGVHPSLPLDTAPSDGMERKETGPSTEHFTRGSGGPLRAKKLGESPRLKGEKKPPLTNEMAAAKYQLMSQIIKAKLAANTFVVDRLKRTGDAFLVEDTGKVSFWGGDPGDLSLGQQKCPITKDSQNVLGTILMHQRSQL